MFSFGVGSGFSTLSTAFVEPRSTSTLVTPWFLSGLAVLAGLPFFFPAFFLGFLPAAFSSSSSSRLRIWASISFLMRLRHISSRSSRVAGQGASLRSNWHSSFTEKSNSVVSSMLVT